MGEEGFSENEEANAPSSFSLSRSLAPFLPFFPLPPYSCAQVAPSLQTMFSKSSVAMGIKMVDMIDRHTPTHTPYIGDSHVHDMGDRIGD